MNFIKLFLFVGLCNINLNIICMQEYEPASQSEQKEQSDQKLLLEKWDIDCICCLLTKKNGQKLEIKKNPKCIEKLDCCKRFCKSCLPIKIAKTQDGKYKIKECYCVVFNCTRTADLSKIKDIFYCTPVCCLAHYEGGYEFINLLCCIKKYTHQNEETVNTRYICCCESHYKRTIRSSK